MRQSVLTGAEIDWQRHGLEPRWIGTETADCSAAFQPATDHSTGGAELERFLAGAAGRGETALVVSMLGYAVDEKRHPLVAAGGDSVSLPGSRYMISGSRLPAGTLPKLADDLNPADKDLGLRLVNSRSPDAPWWALKLSGMTWYAGDGSTVESHNPEGELLPILVDALGAPVVGVWVSPDGQQRWYVIPDVVDWNTVLDWLIQQALPTYVPSVLRRLRTAFFVDPDLHTPNERAARQALADMEIRHAEERTRLEGDLARVQQEAEPVRYGLLYGTGATLVEAVATVLTAAGFAIINLDQELGGPRSADLLATLGQHRRLVEVKGVGGNAAENLVADLQKHLDTWPQLRPQLPVGGGALVVNHQHKLPPDQRTRQVYARREFVNTLTVPVIATRDLFDWWKDSHWSAIQRAVLGTTPPASRTTTSNPPTGRTAAPPSPPAESRSWFRRRRRE